MLMSKLSKDTTLFMINRLIKNDQLSEDHSEDSNNDNDTDDCDGDHNNDDDDYSDRNNYYNTDMIINRLICNGESPNVIRKPLGTFCKWWVFHCQFNLPKMQSQ